MRAGTLRHWLTFEKLLTDGEGNPPMDSDGALIENEWVPAFDLNSRMPCKVTALSGRELLAAQAVQSRVSTRIECRYRPGFDASMRARRGEGTIYNIEAVIPDGESGVRSVTLMCSSGTNEG